MLCTVAVFTCGIFHFFVFSNSYSATETGSIPGVLRFLALLTGGAVVMLAVCVWIPSAIAKIGSSSIVYYTCTLWSITAKLLYPLEVLHDFIGLFFYRMAGFQPGISEEEQFEEEIRTIVTEGHREGLLEEDAREMIESVIEMGDVCVSEIMTPRTDMCCIPQSLTWEEMLGQVITIPHSRIPVYDGNKDDIVGILFIKDLIPELAKVPQERVFWTELLRVPLFVPETKPVDKLLQEFQSATPAEPGRFLGALMQSRHTHIAIVLDEYGGVSGLVSLEDILEEIVGEIVDEHDPIMENEEIHEVSPGVFEVLGKVHLDEINETLDVDLPEEEDFDTIAGYVFSTLGHIPRSGESLFFDKEGKKIKLTVLDATKRRIERIRIEKLPAETAK